MQLNGQPETIERVNTLTFDIFGTVLDLAGSLVPPLEKLLHECNTPGYLTGADVWKQWRLRQRLEQYQENIIMLGHSGYLEVKKKALVYTLRLLEIEFTYEKVDEFMKSYHELIPFQDAVSGLKRLGTKYRLVILSNGEEWYLKQLIENNIGIEFNEILCAEMVSQFKPHPSVYRFAANRLELEPAQIMMVASHSFDILGARHSGFRGAYVNRYGLPYEESEFRPDFIVNDFEQLCDKLGV